MKSVTPCRRPRFIDAMLAQPHWRLPSLLSWVLDRLLRRSGARDRIPAP